MDVTLAVGGPIVHAMNKLSSNPNGPGGSPHTPNDFMGLNSCSFGAPNSKTPMEPPTINGCLALLKSMYLQSPGLAIPLPHDKVEARRVQRTVGLFVHADLC